MVILNKWFSLLAKVCLKTRQDYAEDKKWGKEKEVEDGHLIRYWSCDSLVMDRGGS